MPTADPVSNRRTDPAAKFPLIAKLNDFLTTPQYVAFIMILTLLSNVFSLELVVYSIFILTAIYICLLGRDLLPLMPIFLGCYFAPSVANNPGRNEETVFSGAGGIYLGILGALLLAACLYRVIRDRKRYTAQKYPLLPSIALLSVAYLLGGIGSLNYIQVAPRNLLFAFLQGASIWAPYLLFGGGVNWKNVRRDYFAWIGFFAGAVLLCQLGWIYLSKDIIVNGVIHRSEIFTGWGIHNNLGGMLAMMIPFAFYLSTKYHKGWLGTVCGSAFLIGVIMSCSRNAILTGCAIYLMCLILMLYYANNRKGNTIAALICISAVSAIVILFSQQLLRLFSDILSLGFDPNSRDGIYAQGMKLFSKYPIFGGSFFSTEYQSWSWSVTESFTGFFPPRWHNTFVQMLASCGAVGMIAYLVHRAQTFCMILRKHNKEKTFIGCALLALLICSLFDCHFFNLGPTLFYSMALVFAEKCHEA